MIGGAARSTAVQRIAADLFGLPVIVPEPAEYVALGAVRQAAWTLLQEDTAPHWKRETITVEPDPATGEYYLGVRATYAAVLAAAAPLLA